MRIPAEAGHRVAIEQLLPDEHEHRDAEAADQPQLGRVREDAIPETDGRHRWRCCWQSNPHCSSAAAAAAAARGEVKDEPVVAHCPNQRDGMEADWTGLSISLVAVRAARGERT